MTQFVYGKNVVAQLLDDGRKIHEVWLMQGFRDQKLVRRVQEARIPVKWVNRAQLDAKVKTNRHQGVAACIDAYRTYSVDEILEAIPEGKNGLIIMLDELEDPHNLGAILRSADAVGADGIIIGRHRSVSLTPAVAKVSTGPGMRRRQHGTDAAVSEAERILGGRRRYGQCPGLPGGRLSGPAGARHRVGRVRPSPAGEEAVRLSDPSAHVREGQFPECFSGMRGAAV